MFIHVPKAAGTSINQALYGRFMGHARASDIEKWGSVRLRALPRFSVVRNPWDRLVSAYRFAKRGRGIGKAVAGMRDPEQYRVPEFDTFERFVHEWLVPRDIARIDPVFQPQSLFVCDRGKELIVDHVGRLEDLRPTYAFIDDKLGEQVGFDRQNRSGAEIDYRSFYTPGLVALVGQIYQEDIARFGYDFG